LRFARSVLREGGGIRINPSQITITPKPLTAGALQLGEDNFTLTQQVMLKPNMTYQVSVWDGPLPASALFTTGSAFPAGSISGQISISSSSSVSAVDHAYVALLTSPPSTTNMDSLPVFRIVGTVDGKFRFTNLPDSTYYVFAAGYYGGGEGYDQQISTTLVPAPLKIAGGNAITGANYALGGSSTASPPRVVSFNVAVVQNRQPIAVFFPTVSARVTDANGDNTIASVFVRKPDGSVVTVPRVSDGVYEGVLDPLYTFAGGTYRLWAVDNTGLESAVATDSISPPSLPEPAIISPANNASNVSLTPLLDWSDVVGAAGYVVNVSTENPISFSDPAGAVARFLDPAKTVVNFADAPVTVSELRIPSGRLKPNTTYYWGVGAIDKMVDHDHVSLSLLPSFTTGTGTAVADTLPPVFTKTPEVTSVDSSSIALGWVTDEASDTRVRFGRSAGVYTDSLAEPTMTKVHAIRITGLAPATEYFLEVSSRDHAGNVARMPLQRSVITRDRADRTAPNFVAGPTTERVDVNSVTIYWANDEPTTAVVNLVGVGKDTTVYDTRLVREHRLDILGLSPTTSYAYSVSVIDAAGNGPTIRPGQAFVTKGLPDTNPPRALTGPVVTANERDAFIAWVADELHTARVEIALAGAQGVMFSETFVDIPAVSQLARLTGLAPGTEYRAIVEMTDLARNTTKTRPITFWTKSVPDTIPPRILRFPTVVYRADTRAIVEWETDEMADSYLELYQGARLVNTFNRGDLVRVHRFVLTNLQAGTAYSFRVINADAARNQVVWPLTPPSAKPTKEAGGRTGSEFTTAVLPDQTAPQVVSGPTVLSATATTVTVGWNTDENANSVVRFGEGSAGRIAREGATVEFTDAVTITENVISHQVTLTGLKPGTAYTYQIGSTDPSGNGETTSNPQTVYTLHEEDLAAPLILGGPAVIGRTDSRITVKWTTDEPSNSKLLFRRVGSADQPTEVVVPDNVIEHVVTLTNLLPSQSYEITVQSSDLVGNGPASASVTGATEAAADTKAPSFTGGPTVSADATQALISWTTDEPSDTRVEYGTTVALGLVVNLATFSTNHSVTLTNLTPATQYYYRISSGDASGNIADSTSGSLVWTTLASADVTPPEKVTGVTSINGAYSVRLSWAANTDADLDVYVIERAIGAGGFAKIADQKVTTFTDQAVLTGTTYRYRLLAQDRSANR
ncbi:MAG TPA: fibronectin type III domain-containing protein, partial [Candidatus Latescibacteria bacterium]|nr:fibronectin type III domain-containing protein [Candidatus Latescibacterota bacterium]